MVSYLRVDIGRSIINGLKVDRISEFYGALTNNGLTMDCNVRSEGKYRKIITILEGDVEAAIPALNEVRGFSASLIK